MSVLQHIISYVTFVLEGDRKYINCLYLDVIEDNIIPTVFCLFCLCFLAYITKSLNSWSIGSGTHVLVKYSND